MPAINNKERILIICEGDEEYEYMLCLKGCCVQWEYNVTLKKANGIGNIYAAYTYWSQQYEYSSILVFCDTEAAPYDQYKKLKNKINKYHNGDIADNIVFFANPCTMQIILSHFQKVKLKYNSKNKNSNMIEQCTGVKNYEGKKNQIKNICNKITYENYLVMKENLKSVSTDENCLPSTNILTLFANLESSDDNWIKKINKKLNKEK